MTLKTLGMGIAKLVTKKAKVVKMLGSK